MQTGTMRLRELTVRYAVRRDREANRSLLVEYSIAHRMPHQRW